MFRLLLLWGTVLCACGGLSSPGTTNPPPAQQAAMPTITTGAAQNGAVIVTLADTTNGAKIYYTLDGSAPTNTSQIYQAPFLVAANLTVNAIAAEPPTYLNSNVATRTFAPNIASGMLVWSDEFSNSGSSKVPPNSSVWTYDTGLDCCGNNELETYCAPTSNAAPCSPSNPNAFVGTDGYLHIVAMQPTAGVKTYTSARLKSEGMLSFMYGRIEARMKLPESQGMWPAFWMLGNNIATLSWPACGEIDIMEHIDGSNPPPYVGGTPPGYDWMAGSVHGGTSGSAEINGTNQYHPSGYSAAAWHTYGMIWSKGQIEFYVDDPANVYATFKSTDSQWTSGSNNLWPFDVGPQFLILNLAVGGDWPGSPDGTTVFPSEMMVDYVRVYTN
jgi:beta-glucanase (GH16 family)